MNHGRDTDTHVFFYEHDYYPFSSFSAFRVRVDVTIIRRGADPSIETMDFDTAEVAYHWHKFYQHYPNIAHQILTARSSHAALKMAQELKTYVRFDWTRVKIDIMRQIIRAKYDQHEYVRRKLLATGTRVLVEDSWRDAFWGVGSNNDGLNMLGQLWMELRDGYSLKGLATGGLPVLPE